VQIQISGRHLTVTEQMDRHIREQIAKLPPFAEKTQHIDVTLTADSGTQVVEIAARIGRADLVAQASSHDMYHSIDEAFAKMERQLVRQHDKLVRGRAREGQKE